MRPYRLIPVLLLISSYLLGQKIVLSTVEDIGWGSLSFDGPNYGFYGQEFEIERDAKLESISVYIFDHWDYDETKSTVNFAVWGFDSRPTSQLFLSEAQKITEKSLNGWLRYKLEKPLELKKGKYLIAVGQPAIQGFVAFGNTKARDGYKSAFWMKSPWGEFFDGTKWYTVNEWEEKTGSSSSDQKLDKEELDKSVMMLRIVLSN